VLPGEECFAVRNDTAGWAELIERLRGFSIAAIGIEANGGYERGVMRALLAAGMAVRHVNPFRLRQFARASGVLAKNDPIDARMLLQQYLPGPDVSRCSKTVFLLDQVVGGHLHDQRHRDAECLRRFEIDDEFDLGRLHHRKLGGLLTL
jgi:transposase